MISTPNLHITLAQVFQVNKAPSGSSPLHNKKMRAPRHIFKGSTKKYSM
jgi:hypothetical protein